MGALLDHTAIAHCIDAVAVHHVCQTVGDQDDRLFPGKTVDGPHDVVLALGIHVGGSLVEEVDGRIMQQGAGHGKALALTAGKIAAAFMQGGLQAILAAAEIGQIHLFQCVPQLCFGGIRL